MSFFSFLFFVKTNKTHSFPSSFHPFLLPLFFLKFPNPKKPKNKTQNKNWLDRKPKPKNQINTLQQRGQGSKKSRRGWTTTPLVLISIWVAITALIRCIAALSLFVYLFMLCFRELESEFLPAHATRLFKIRFATMKLSLKDSSC